MASAAPQPVAHPAAGDGLPHPLRRMIGREEFVRSLLQRLLADRFVTLRGPGGIGKTTVAVALAHEAWVQFDGEVRFLDLGALTDPGLVASLVASAFGQPA